MSTVAAARMTCIERLLRQVAGQVEGEVQRALSGFEGFFVSPYLPQTWNVKTESESVILMVDSSGRARVSSGSAQSPDVTIEATHRLANAALSGDRRTPGPYANEPPVTTPTPKGQATWQFLRGRIA